MTKIVPLPVPSSSPSLLVSFCIELPVPGTTATSISPLPAVKFLVEVVIMFDVVGVGLNFRLFVFIGMKINCFVLPIGVLICFAYVVCS